MSNLIIKNNAPQSLQSSLSKMLESRTTEQGYTLLLCDTSGSMGETAKGRRKIETLAETVNKLIKKHRCKLIAFSNSAKLVSELKPHASGGTDMAAALRLAATQRCISKTIVISDGYPDDAQAALIEARKLVSPICCIYIGPGEDEGYKFLCELARLGKGQASYTGNDTNLIEQKINLLLTA